MSVQTIFPNALLCRYVLSLMLSSYMLCWQLYAFKDHESGSLAKKSLNNEIKNNMGFAFFEHLVLFSFFKAFSCNYVDLKLILYWKQMIFFFLTQAQNFRTWVFKKNRSCETCPKIMNDGTTVSECLLIHTSVLNEINIRQKVSFSSVFVFKCNRGICWWFYSLFMCCSQRRFNARAENTSW